MGTDQIMYCVVALILGMLLANMLKNVCGCKTVVEGGNLGGMFDWVGTDVGERCWNPDTKTVINDGCSWDQVCVKTEADQKKLNSERNQTYAKKPQLNTCYCDHDNGYYNYDGTQDPDLSGCTKMQ